MNKFTEGPWSVYGTTWERAADESEGKGPLIMAWDEEAEESIDIALVNYEENPEANAHLIAAAPTLYAACRAALVEFGDDELYHMHRGIYATLLAAILHAEGGPAAFSKAEGGSL